MPAGSLRCDKFVRSSLASSMAGFMRGGREALLSSWSAAKVVWIVFDCFRLREPYPDGPFVNGREAYLPVSQLKN